MDRKADIQFLWNIQEGLLQQYRIMAITLLGLIAAGILVLISFLLGDDAASNWRTDEFGTTVILLLMFGTLWFLGIVGTHQFRRIILERSHIVTFFQNMLIAAESGKLDDIVARSGVPEKIPFMFIFRRIQSRGVHPIPLPLEACISFDVDLFIREISLEKEFVGDWRLRHHKTRAFLSSFIFAVFYVFYALSGLILLTQSWKYMGASIRIV